MKGGSFLFHIQTAFHQFCLIGPGVGAVGDGWDENATNGLKLMLASLTLQIYSTLPKCFSFSFFFGLCLSPFLPFPSSTLTTFRSIKRSRSYHISQYPFNWSCFSTSWFPLHLHLSCQIIWQCKLGSIFHLSTMVNQCYQSCTTCGSSWLNCTCQGKNGQQWNEALAHYWCVCVWVSMCVFVH